jgi:acyl carrier protein
MSSNQDIQKSIRAIVAESIQVPQEMVTADLAFGDIPQWDSLGHMEIILRLEEAYNFSIDTELIARLISIPEICNFLKENGYVQ